MAKKDDGVVNIRASKFSADNGLTYFITEEGEVWRKLKPSMGGGYPSVQLGRGRHYHLHRLVAESFLPKPEGEGLEVRHLDHDKMNCHVSNLAWGTRSQNAKDTRDANCSGQQKITQEIANEIRQMAQAIGYGYRKVAAEKFGISESHCTDIVSGRTWR